MRALVPQLEVFGGTVGRTIDGALQVGKLMPHLAETRHLTGHDGPPAFGATQVETYTCADETTTVGFHTLLPQIAVPLDEDGAVDLVQLERSTRADWVEGSPMIYRVETFPVGTTFSTWVRLERASDLAAAFFVDVLAEWTRRGRIGGRRAIGHGEFRADLTPDVTPPAVDWRCELVSRRAEVIDAICALA